MITIENLYFTYPNGKEILHGIDWEIDYHDTPYVPYVYNNGSWDSIMLSDARVFPFGEKIIGAVNESDEP